MVAAIVAALLLGSSLRRRITRLLGQVRLALNENLQMFTIKHGISGGCMSLLYGSWPVICLRRYKGYVWIAAPWLAAGRPAESLFGREPIFYEGVDVMSISALTSTALSSASPLSSTSSQTTSSSAVSGHHHHHGGDGGQLMQSIEQALSQMGITLGSGSQSQTGSQSASSDSGSSSTQNPQQALHQLMGDIFSAVQNQQASSTTSSTGSTANSQYSNFSTGLQSLISSLNNSSSSTSSSTSGNSELNQLQSDFSNFLSAVQSANGGSTSSSSSTTAQTQNVQTFLQNLESSLAGGSLTSSGGLLGTST
jgi:hypothetical protein